MISRFPELLASLSGRSWDYGQHLCPHLVATDTNNLPGPTPAERMTLSKLNRSHQVADATDTSGLFLCDKYILITQDLSPQWWDFKPSAAKRAIWE